MNFIIKDNEVRACTIVKSYNAIVVVDVSGNPKIIKTVDLFSTKREALIVQMNWEQTKLKGAARKMAAVARLLENAD
jgi:hypothetical protein